MNSENESPDYAETSKIRKISSRRRKDSKSKFEIHGLNSFQIEESGPKISNSESEETPLSNYYKKETKGFLNSIDMCINEFEARKTSVNPLQKIQVNFKFKSTFRKTNKIFNQTA